MSGAPVLSVDELVFAYGALPLFDGWSHAFVPGLTWIRGDNGCGKSTLLRLIGGALEPRAGTIRYDDLDMQAQPIDYRRHVYWCGPDGPAFDHLKPAEFFGFVAGLYPRFDRELPARLVRSLGVEAFMGRRIRELSTGSRKKVGVIAAMASGCPVVLLDEPLAAVDQASSRVLKEHFAEVAAGRDRIWIAASHEPLTEAGARLVELRPRT